MADFQDPIERLQQASDEHAEQELTQKKSFQVNNIMVFYGIAFLIVLATLIFHTYPRYQELVETQATIVDTETNIGQLRTDIDEDKKNQSRLEIKLEQLRKERGPLVNAVFPVGESIEELTRFIEAYSVSLQKFGQMELNSVSYRSPQYDENYGWTEMSVTFKSNQENFVRFLQMLNNAGSLEEKNFFNGRPVRLMRIESINIAIPDRDAFGDDDLYGVDLTISAFFQMTAEEKAEWAAKNG